MFAGEGQWGGCEGERGVERMEKENMKGELAVEQESRRRGDEAGRQPLRIEEDLPIRSGKRCKR